MHGPEPSREVAQPAPSALESQLLGQLDRSEELFWHRLRWRLVSSYLPAESEFELVDVGAGAGTLGSFLDRDHPGAVYRFVEPLESLRANLIARFGAEADAGGAEAHRGADFVTLLDVLEHQPDDRAFLAELVGKAERGATILITVPAMPLLWSSWDEALGHHRRYTRRSLRDAFSGLAVEPLEVSYLFPELIPPALWRKAARGAGAGTKGEADAPVLPRPLDAALYRLGLGSLRLRRIWPIGTSLFAALRRVDG